MRSSEYTVPVRAGGAAQLFADRFAIEDEAGVGNMGVVYRAVDRITSGHVALKVLHPHRAPEIGRFVAEMSTLAGIQHPAVIRYLSHGITVDDERFLVTEWIDGETLAARLLGGALSVANALALGRRIADGLDVLHAAGVLHGDLKLSNVFLPRSADGRSIEKAKLLDFGIPSPFLRAPAQDPRRDKKTLDTRADLASLGAVIFQTLTGARAAAPQAREASGLRALCSDAPPALEALLERLLEKNPEERHESAAEVRDLLAAISRERQDEEPFDSVPKTLSSAPSSIPESARPHPSRSRTPPVSVADDVADAGFEIANGNASDAGSSATDVDASDAGSEAVESPRSSHESGRALRSGMTFAGRYLLEARVGVGGMGELFRAFDTRLRRNVALKVLHRERALHAPFESSARILREARAAAALSHANVVAIHDVGEHDGVPFIAMEYVEGHSLRAFVGTPDPPFETRLGWMIAVARALAAAHEKGLVHRDVKPDNVMIREDGTVKVLDFGIARYPESLPEIRLPQDGGPGEPSDLAADANTRVVGTPGYMAPEQTRGDRIDGRADQFSWGVVAFEVFSGTLPWPMQRGGLSIAAAALSERPKPLGEPVPPHVAQVVERALAKVAVDRFPSMKQLVAALGADVESADSARGGGASSRADSRASSERERERASGSGMPARPRSWLAGGRSTLLVATLLVLMAFTVVVGRSVFGGKAHPRRSDSAAAPPADTAIIALPASPKCNAIATAHYRDGLAALREASWEMAHGAFTDAATADPSCPEAQLRRVMTAQWFEPIGKQREHFRLAAELRDGLSERDRVLFDSFLPIVILDPPDRDVSWRILESGLVRFPRDAELLLAAASVRMNLALDDAALEHGLELATRATDVDPKYADAWQFQGRVLARLGRLDDELSALDACLRTSPGASDCMHDRTLIMRWRGNCTELAAEARRWIARSPNSGSAYWQLALALAEDGAPDDAIEEAVRQQLSHISDDHHAARWLNAMARLAAFRGDFDKAERLATQLAKQTAGDAALVWHLRPAIILMDAAEEAGHLDRAGDVAEPFLRRAPVWTVGDPTPELMTYEPAMLGILLRQHRISPADWHARASLWEERVAPRLGRLGTWSFRWGPASELHDVALEAWRNIPGVSEQTPTFGFNGFDLRMADIQQGRIALAAGEYARAVEVLEPSAKACLSFEQPFANARAQLWLGEAKEHTADKAGACDAYRFVLERWGGAKPRSKTADEARKRARALGCSGPPVSPRGVTVN